ncbi:MAG: DUF1573 domain-containing protein [Bacteroidota bacterium]
MMKFLFFPAVIFLSLQLSLYAQKHSNDSPVIFVKDTIVDFKTVNQGDKINSQIEVINKGNRKLRISNVRGGCGLMVVSYPREDIAPGDTAAINIKYDSSRLGIFERYLTIHSNSENNTLKIRIRGEIVPE